MALRLLLLLLMMMTATVLIAKAQGIGSSASDCCLNHSKKTIPRDIVTSYRHQGPESGCLLSAIVFTTKKDRQICASPDSPAVQKVMRYLDKVKNHQRMRGRLQRPGGKRKQQKQQKQKQV